MLKCKDNTKECHQGSKCEEFQILCKNENEMRYIEENIYMMMTCSNPKKEKMTTTKTVIISPPVVSSCLK